jgi:hypothetical protein
VTNSDLKAFLALLPIVVLLSCKEEPELQFFNKKGLINGVISLNNSFNAAGTSVHLKGAGYDKTLITGLLGDYEFFNLPTSNFEMEVSKDGYGKVVVFNIRNSGLDTIQGFYLQLFPIPQIDTRTVKDFTTGLASDGTPFIALHYSDSSVAVSNGRIFFGLTDDVSDVDYEYSQPLSTTLQVQNIYFNELSSARFYGAKKVYFRLYPHSGGGYFDYSLDRWIYSSVNKALASEVYEFTFPE